MDRQAVARLIVGVAALVAGEAAAQSQPLFEHEPYDRLTLNDKDHTVLNVQPVELPGGVVPKDPDPKSVLSVRLVDEPARQYEVAWKDVAELRPFARLVLDEAERLTRDGRFVEAFAYFVYLRREHEKLVGLEAAETALSAAEAAAALRDKRPEVAMARLVRLQARAPLHDELPDLLAEATRQLVDVYVQADNPRAARTVAERFARQYVRHPQVDVLQKTLTRISDERLAEARQALADGRFHEAQAAAQTAAALVREPSAALAAYAEAVAAYPVLTVGVVETAATTRDVGAPTWAERRIAPLERRPPLDLAVSPAPPSRATYTGGAARLEPDDRDPLQFHLQLGGDSDGPSAADAAAMLAAAARPGAPTARSDLLNRIAELRVVDPMTLDIRLARLHSRFAGAAARVLAGPSVGVGTPPPPAPFPIAASADDRVTRRRSSAAPGAGPAEIVERAYLDEDEAVNGLAAGEVDLVDRVAPWHVDRLQSLGDIKLVRYATTSVHLLLFNGRNPRLRDAAMRRAICHAIDRESILRNHLQPSATDVAARVIDGVFAAGLGADDPLGYAYDPIGKSRTYDPQRAYLLNALEASDAVDDRPLVLLYPRAATAAKGAARIAAYLNRIGIAVELRAAPADASPNSADDADLTYVVVSSTEPAVDARRWFDVDGLVNLESRALDAALADIDRAESATTVRTALFDLQRAVHDEALVAPLWQLSEYAAHRGRIVPPAKLVPTSLYQQVERYQVLPQYSESLP